MTSTAPAPVKANKPRNAKADRLVLVNLSMQSCKAWFDAVREAGQPWHDQVVDNLAKAKLLLKEHPRAHVLVCYDAPEREVASGIAKERLPSQALANWVNAAEALLDLYRDNFQRMTLVKREALEAHAKDLFGQLAARSGIALGRVAVKSAETIKSAKPTEQQQTIHRLLASQALQHSSAQYLFQELEISSLPLGKPSSLLDVLDNFYNKLLDGGFSKNTAVNNKEHKQPQEKLQILQEENDLIIEQLHRTQEELEQYLLGNYGSSSEVEKLQRDIERKNEKLHSFSQKNKQLTEQLKAMKQSKSWKVTAPLRKMMKVLGGGKGGDA